MPSWLPRRKRWRLLGVFLVLLAASHIVRRVWPPHGSPQPGQQLLEVPVIDDDGEPTGDTTPLYYYDLRPANRSNAPVLVLLHGSPLAPAARAELVKALAPDFRLIVPDLPGFGASVAEDLPDYSLQTYAMQLKSLLDQLGLQRVHVAGFGEGGGVALELADYAPERVQSLELIDSIGVPEYQWLGDPVLNHALYGAQLGAYTAARALLPHFGLLDTGPLNFASTRIFWDTDQRHLRDVLKRYRGPMLIVQAQSDFFVQQDAARESYRLVPQSEWFGFPGGHWTGLRQPELIAPALRDFVQRAEHGLTRSKSQAEHARLVAAIQEHAPAGPKSRTYEALLLVLIAVFTLFGEDMICMGVGVLVGGGVLTYWPAALAVLTGIVLGNLSYYVLGWYFRAGIIQRAPFRWWFKESDLRRLTEAFHQRGTWIVFLSRFVPASRFPVFLTAGILRFPFLPMFVALVVPNALVTLPFVWLASILGQQAIGLIEHYEKAALLVVAVFIFVLVMALHVITPLFTWRGRRLWRSRWRRLTRWEFWPSWVAQAPVLPTLLGLAWRHRSCLVFTCANPGLPAGGFVGEPKSALLGDLAGAGQLVARWTLLPAMARSRAAKDERLPALEGWMAAQQLAWPVVLKQDAGGQGRGVIICRSREEATRYFTDHPMAVIAQEFIPGQEFEVWFYRVPGEPASRILAVSDISFPGVTGDGKHTLEYLILADDRALCSAHLFFAQHAARLADIPPAGETIVLAELGLSLQGALCLEATASLATSELAAELDTLVRHFPGFFFGRVSLRGPSADDLRAGRNLRVLSLVGVKAAGSVIRDPHRPLSAAWEQSRRQWEICFTIGAANRERGAHPATWRAILRGLLRSRTGE